MQLRNEREIGLTLGSSMPEKSKYSSLGIMKAAKLAVYSERKTTAKRAQITVIHLVTMQQFVISQSILLTSI